jgi:N-carbamoyl-L-amino-acid hydrolase
VLAQLAADIQARVRLIAEQTRTEIRMELASQNPPALAHPAVQRAIDRAAGRQGVASRRLPSGAGHDAQMMAALCPMGMIFVPSIGGISHSPRESTTWEDCSRGASVLAEVILDLDASDTIE